MEEGFADLTVSCELLAEHVCGRRPRPVASLVLAVSRVTELLPLLHQHDECEETSTCYAIDLFSRI